MANLADLLVSLSLDSAALKSGLKEAKSAVESFGEKLAGIDEKLKSIGQMEGVKIAGEVIKGLGEFVQKGAEAAAQMGILAHSAQVPVAAFSKLSYAANLSGVATEDLAGVFNKLNKNLGLAGAGVPANAALFDALGIKIHDVGGKVKSSSAIFGELAGKFSGMEEGASKAALEMEVFGKTGAALDTMLGLGVDGLARLGDEADRFGLTIGPAASEAAHEFEQNLTKLQLAGNAVGTKVAANLAPALTDLTNQLLHSQAGADLLKGAVEVLTTAVKLAASGAVIVTTLFAGFGALIAEVAEKLVALSHGDLKEVARANDEYAATVKGNAAKMKAALSTIWDGPSAEAKKAADEMEKAAKTSSDKIQAAFEAQKKAITESEAAQKELNKTLDEWVEKLNSADKSPLDKLEAQLAGGKIGEQLAKLTHGADAFREALRMVGTQLIELKALDLNKKIAFDLSRTDAATAFGVQQKSAAFQNIGTPLADQNLTKGFASFDAAITAYADDVHNAAVLSGQAEAAKGQENTVLAQLFTTLSDKSKLAAEQALKAADAFSGAKERLVEADKVRFELSRQASATDESVKQRTAGFNNVGSSAYTIRGQQEAGFSSFGEAIGKYAKTTEEAAAYSAEATERYRVGDIAGGQAMTLFADQAKLAAEKAGRAADAFEGDAAALSSAISGGVGILTSKMGEAGAIINAGMQGMMSGGPIAAIIAVIAELVSRLKVFSDFADKLNAKLFKSLDELNTALGPIFAALTAFSDALKPVQEVIHSVIGAVLKIIQPMFENLAKVFGSLGKAIEPLAGAFQAVGGILGQIGEALGSMEPMMQVLGVVFRVVGATINFLAIGIMSAVSWFERAIGQYTSANALDAQIKVMTDKQRAFDAFKDPVVDAVPPIVELGNQAQKTADKFGELLTNLPSGYKVGAAVFGADNGTGGLFGSSGSAGGVSAVGGLGAGAGSSAAATQAGLDAAAAAAATAAADAAATAAFDRQTADNASALGDVTAANAATNQWVASANAAAAAAKAAADAAAAANAFRASTGTAAGDVAAGSGISDLSANEAATWLTIYNNALINGQSSASAAAAADAYIRSHRTGSSSSAATAAGGGVTNIGGGGGSGIQQLAGGGGDTIHEYHFHEGSILPRDFGHFVEQVSEKQRQKEGQKHRNPTRTKR